MSFILLYAGHFLFSHKYGKDNNSAGNTGNKTVTVIPPASFTKLTMEIRGNKQEVRVLEIDLTNENTDIRPVLSHDSIFGFEKLSSIVKRTNAYAAVNGGFFSEYGQPGGMTAIDGRLLTKPTGKYPVFIIKEREALLENLSMDLKIRVKGKEIPIDNINTPPQPGQVILYTPDYGDSNRLEMKNISVIIKENVVYDIGEYGSECDIPADGMVLSFTSPLKYEAGSIPFSQNDTVELNIAQEMKGIRHAYECGSWIVRGEEIVIGDRDDWVGLLTNPDPRTAVGIKKDGKVMLVVVDGRQPGYSTGVSGKELGIIMLKLGAVDAAMLDGGSSSEMIFEGNIVNRPSYKGEERLLGGALVVTGLGHGDRFLVP